jgi:hypothetical protein
MMEGLEGKGGWQGNITIETRKNEDGKGGQLIFRGETEARNTAER